MLKLVDKYDLGSYAKTRESSSLSTRTNRITLFIFLEITREVREAVCDRSLLFFISSRIPSISYR